MVSYCAGGTAEILTLPAISALMNIFYFYLNFVNVQLRRRGCTVFSDDGVQLKTVRVFNSAAVFSALKPVIQLYTVPW